MTDAYIHFYNDGKRIGTIPSSLESLDYCEISVPTNILNRIHYSTELTIRIEVMQAENN